MLSLLRKATGTVLAAGRAVNKIPVVGTLAKSVPILGTGLAAIEGARLVSSAFGGAKAPGGLPMLPGAGAGGLPALMGAAASTPIPMGSRSIFRNDPNVIAALQQFAIPKAALRQAFRAPPGFVVLRDQVGDPYGLPKVVARMMGLWKAPHKPPISVGDWQAVKRADRTVKKVRKIMTTMARVDKAIGGGKVKIKKGGRK